MMKQMKKCMAVVLIGAMGLLSACGTGNVENDSAPAEQAEKAPALDLSGSWIAETQGTGYYLAGFIKGNRIELHWVSSYDQYGSVYWAGGYKAPKDDSEPYSWTSKRNDAIMATTAYGAPETERTFTYADGKLTLEASDTAGSYAVVLIPSEIDYTGLAVDVPGADENDASEGAKKTSDDKTSDAVDDAAKAAEEKVKNVKLISSGYSVESLGGGSSLVYYAVEVSNPNKYNAITSPTIEITVRGKDGSLISKQKKNLAGIAPRERLIFGDAIKCQSNEPGEVEIKVKNSDYDITPYEGSGVQPADALKVDGVKEDHSGDTTAFKGKVTNTTEGDLTGVVLSVVFKKNGDIVGGITEYVNTLAAGETKDFSVLDKGDFNDYDDFEVYATMEG